MKLLAFSDLHRDRGQAQQLVELSHQADVMVGAGDFASMRVGLSSTIEELSASPIPAILVPGNNESDDALRKACRGWPAATVLHGTGTEIEGTQFFGLGGGVPPTPFPWSFDLDEELAASLLGSCPEGAILVIHSPPKGYVDEVRGRSFGSMAILRAIEEKRPPLALCGHIHQCWGEEARVGQTRVVNVGPEGMYFEV